MRKRMTNGLGLATACCCTVVLHGSLPPSSGQEPPMTTADADAEAPRIPLRYGPFDIHPRVGGGVLYDDNIYIQPSGEEEDLIWNLSPGVMLGAGDYVEREANLLTLDYAPNFVVFTRNDGENTIDHAAELMLELNEERWQMVVSQQYQQLSGVVIDVGTRVERQVFTTLARFEYEISPKTSFDLDGRMFINDYEDVSDYNEWRLGGGVDYLVTPKLKMGVGGVFGAVDVANSVNQTYEQLLLRASFEVSEKVTARGSVGGELRQFQGGDDDQNLVFSLGGTYRVMPNTVLALEGYRRVQNSVVAVSENYTTLGVSLGVRQTIRERYGVYGAVGYENSDYSAHASAVGTARDDDYYLFRGGVDWSVTDRLAVGAYYQYRKNDSSVPAVDFVNNQVGLTAAFQF